MQSPLALAAVTDEFSPDLDVAVPVMAQLGLAGAELRLVWGKNIIDLTDEEARRARAVIEGAGLRVLSLATPILKCTLPEGGPVDQRFPQDLFSARFTLADQPRLIDRAFALAQITGARLLRVFSYWRTIDPAACRPAVIDALRPLADAAHSRGLVIGLENEHACNVGTGVESAALLDALPHPALALIWDPANARVLGERPFPDGYARLPTERIAHVHAKDCRVDGHTPVWGIIGTMDVDWRGQIRALLRDGYRGAISLETHWTWPRGDKLEASILNAGALSALVATAR